MTVAQNAINEHWASANAQVTCACMPAYICTRVRMYVQTLTGRVLISTADNTDSAASDRSVNSSTMTAVQCHTGFVSICGLCLPSCQDFHLDSQLGTSHAVDGIFLVTGTVLVIVGALAFVVLSVIRRKDV